MNAVVLCCESIVAMCTMHIHRGVLSHGAETMSVCKFYKIYILGTPEVKLTILKADAYPVFFQLFYLVPALLTTTKGLPV